MSTSTIALAVLLLTILGFGLGRGRAVRAVAGETRLLHSRPIYHGSYVALWCGLPALIVIGIWVIAEPMIIEAMVRATFPDELRQLDKGQLSLVLGDIRALAAGRAIASTPSPAMVEAAHLTSSLRGAAQGGLAVLALGVAVVGLGVARQRVGRGFRARPRVETAIRVALVACSTLAILTTIGIVLSLVAESLLFFEKISPFEFLFGLEWSPQTALRADQVGASGHFGAIPLFVGTLLVSLIAMVVAAPIGLFAAIYLSEYASQRVRTVVKPLLEVLAGIPTVVYGFFAALAVGPWLRDLGIGLGLAVSSESAMAAGLVMGIMIIPFVSSLSDDVINAVPQSMREGSLGLGATQSETIRKVVIPAALPGIVGSFMLAISRAIGETMIVVMAAGLSANLTANPFQAVTTVTVQIVTLLVGDQEFDSPKTLAAFALGLALFMVTLVLNVIALRVVEKYREQYE